MRARTRRSQSVSRSKRGLDAAAGQELADHVRIDDGAAGGDPVKGAKKLGDVADAVFEQVAHGGAGLDELGGVGVLDVLGQDQNGQARVGAAELQGGTEPFVAEVGRHLDVGDDRIGWVSGDGGEQARGVGDGGDLPRRTPRCRYPTPCIWRSHPRPTVRSSTTWYVHLAAR
jgi:hypothetical protein